MATPVVWNGANKVLQKPKGLDDLSCQALPIYSNGQHCVSCWELTDEELATINRTKKIFLSVWSGYTQPPVYIGTEDTVREVIADAGVWKK